MNAIFYKEWIKTRWYLLLALVVTVGFAGYSMLRINRVVTLKGVEHVWEVMLQRDAVFVDLLQYIPLLAGILLAVVQFVPEMHRKCLKLTLHLPYSQLRMVMLMLLYGLLVLLVCFGFNYVLMGFDGCSLVFGRNSRISACVLDLSGTFMEAAYIQPDCCCTGVTYLFPFYYAGSL